MLLEYIIKSKDEEMYKAKYMVLAEEHMVALQQVLSLKEKISSLEDEVSEFPRKLRKKL